jgi:SRSO17 transposase
MISTGSIVGFEDVSGWGAELDAIAHRIGARFARSETRDRVRAYLVGLLGPVQRKNSWQVAEQIGDADPYGVQYLLGRSDWDPEEVRDDLRDFVVETLGDADAVLILDETGFLKKGTHSAGVARQYTGTAGRIENAQVGVFLAYASRHGTAFLDRALYLPKEWTDDPSRCEQAGVPEGTAFATKPRLAKAMLERAFKAGVPAAWVTGDEVYGSDGDLRRWLEQEKRPYVLAVRSNQSVWVGFRQVRVGALAAELPKRAWHEITIAAGSKGPRRYAWAWVRINHDLGPKWRRWLLVRKSLEGDQELAFYLAASPARTTLTRLAKVAGARWSIEGGFESAKQEVGLADYEVRSWTGWYRHVTLSLLAHAVLASVRKLADGPPQKSRPKRRS